MYLQTDFKWIVIVGYWHSGIHTDIRLFTIKRSNLCVQVRKLSKCVLSFQINIRAWYSRVAYLWIDIRTSLSDIFQFYLISWKDPHPFVCGKLSKFVFSEWHCDNQNKYKSSCKSSKRCLGVVISPDNCWLYFSGKDLLCLGVKKIIKIYLSFQSDIQN